jgi:HEAT repeat protein
VFPLRLVLTLSALASAPDETLSDLEVSSRVATYLRRIDSPVEAEQWQALGPRAIPLLEQVLTNPRELPSRRASAVSGLAEIGGPRARERIIQIARSESEPFAVRAAALDSAPRVLDSQELIRELSPVLEKSRQPLARAAAAEVLARNAPSAACAAVRAQAAREPEGKGRFERALEGCESSP